MEKPTHNENNDAIVCIMCDKLGSGSGSSTNLGNIIQISRGIVTSRAAAIEQDELDKFLQTDFK